MLLRNTQSNVRQTYLGVITLICTKYFFFQCFCHEMYQTHCKTKGMIIVQTQNGRDK